MASKAPVFPHHAYGPAVPRQRRPVHFQAHDPVVLPRSRDWDLSAGLIGAAAIATLLVTGATYAVYYTEPPRLTPTEAPALEREYLPQGDVARVNVARALSGPVAAAPSAAAYQRSGPAATPSAPSPLSSDREVSIDDSAAGVQESLPQPLENQPNVTPYPDPTTTPPDAISPPDDENPYR